MAPIVEELRVGEPMKKFACLMNLVPFVFALAALILGTAPSFYCETLQITQDDGNDELVLLAGPYTYKLRDGDEDSGWDNYGSFATGRSGGFGVYPECQQYRALERGTGFKYEADHATRAVWVFSILTPLFGILLAAKAVSAATCPGFFGLSKRGSWKCLGYSLVATSVLQGLTLLSQASSLCNNNPFLQYLDYTGSELSGTFPATCQWATGYSLQIAAVALWMLAGGSTFLIPEPVVNYRHPHVEQTVNYTQAADGNIEEARVTVVKGTPVAGQ